MKNKGILLILLIICILLGGLFLLPKEEAPLSQEDVAPTVTEAPQETKAPVETEAPKATAEPMETQTPPPAPKEEEPVAPAPTEPPKDEEKEELVCSLLVRCDNALKNLDKLKKGKAEYLPADGIVLSVKEVPFTEGESGFDVLERMLKEHKIHFEFTKTKTYNSAYIEGINNLYEFDCGESSGWLYKVNGVRPNYGSSSYKVQKGDNIEFYYSCNLFDE